MGEAKYAINAFCLFVCLNNNICPGVDLFTMKKNVISTLYEGNL